MRDRLLAAVSAALLVAVLAAVLVQVTRPSAPLLAPILHSAPHVRACRYCR
jgi:hypothetical protein